MRVALLLLLVITASVGCRVSPRAEREIALLRAEILDLEDQYYTLKSQRDLSDGLETGEFSGSSFVDDGCVNCGNDTIIYDDAPGVSYDNQQDFGTAPQSSTEPTLNIQRQNDSNGSGSRLENQPTIEEILPQSPSILDQSFNEELKQQNGDRGVARVVIDRRHSGGQDLDGSPGHEGLSLLIQPQDETGKVLEIPGHLIVRIMERDSVASARQIGLWQFTPEEIASFFIKDEYAQQGILLHLPWDKQKPSGRRLTVFVRYTTGNRKNLDSSVEISIDPPSNDYSPEDPVIAQWIERDERWKDVDSEFLNNASEPRPGNRATAGGDPLFRVDSNPERRTSVPRWRPVR